MRILVSGCTAMQVNSERRVTRIVTSLPALVACLKSLGHDVDWRPITVGENLDAYDRVIVSLQPMSSWGTKYMGGVLWAIYKHTHVIYTADDWQVGSFMASVKGLDKREDYFDKTIWSHWEGKCEPLLRMRLRSSINHLVVDGIKRILLPGWAGGDHSLFKMPGTSITIYDPSPFCELPTSTFEGQKRRNWICASLTAKDTWVHKQKQVSRWSIEEFGNVRKGQEKLPEDRLFQRYCESWGVMSPPHNVSGSGWFRWRFYMAAAAGCVTLCSNDEGKIFGDAYRMTLKQLESLTEGGLTDLALDQYVQLNDKSWSKERLSEVIERTLQS